MDLMLAPLRTLGWTISALFCLSLVVSWGASQERASEIREQFQQGRLFE